jgi:hypothetical protein
MPHTIALRATAICRLPGRNGPLMAKAMITNWITALRNTPMFSVTAPAICAASNVGWEAPFNVTKILLKSTPPTSRPIDRRKYVFDRSRNDRCKSRTNNEADRKTDYIAAQNEGFELTDPTRGNNMYWGLHDAMVLLCPQIIRHESGSSTTGDSKIS